MSNRELPMMPWFPQDFAGATVHFCFNERSAYRALLDAQWVLGELPNDETRLARIIGMTAVEFASVWSMVKTKFIERAGGLVNERLEEHRVESRRLVDARREAGVRGGQASAVARSKRVAKPVATVQPKLNGAATNGAANVNHPSPSPSPSPSVEEKKIPSLRSGAKENGSQARPAKRCPESFVVTEAMRSWAKAECKAADVDAETAAFRDHEWRSAKTDWAATWRNWMRRASTWKPSALNGSPRLTRYEQLHGVEDVVIGDEPMGALA